MDQQGLAAAQPGLAAIASCAVMNASGTAAACSNDRPSGIFATRRSWVTTASA